MRQKLLNFSQNYPIIIASVIISVFLIWSCIFPSHGLTIFIQNSEPIFVIVASVFGLLAFNDWKRSKKYELKVDILEKTYNDFMKVYNFVESLASSTGFEWYGKFEKFTNGDSYRYFCNQRLNDDNFKNTLISFSTHQTLYKARFGDLPKFDEENDIFHIVESLI